MSRFHSRYEIAMTDKQLNEDLLNNNDRCKDELKVALNNDNHRSNVDRAKKKAVVQYMDYDNFHQMVLGADLKGMKMVDVMEIKPDRPIMNLVSEQEKIKQNKNDMFLKDFVKEEANQNEIKFLVDDDLNLHKFKTNWKKFSTNVDKINYFTDNIPTEEIFDKIFKAPTIDADLFVDLIFNFGTFALNSEEENKKIEYLFKCLKVLMKYDYFKKLKMFIGRKQKTVYEELSKKDWFINSKENQNYKELINEILK